MTDHSPLAERMRPQSLADYVGQKQLIGKDSPLQISLSNGILPSLILWGPPGVGKTTLAFLLAKTINKKIHTLSAISSGVKDVRDIIHSVEKGGLFQESRPILFIDEIHRFSKSQQDSLLNAVEKGIITLLGATTENPSFEVIPALLSRCQVYILEHHSKEELIEILEKAVKKDKILAEKSIEFKEYDALLRVSGGDARKLLNTLELIVSSQDSSKKICITNELVSTFISSNPIAYDKTGENHYDIASALIKSIRGSDVNASVYWLARMIEGGEDPKFIARRLLISASEDIGLANPNALLLANSTFQAVQAIGWPESRIILSECVIYLASSPKGNAAYMAINKAQEIVKQTGNLSVPYHLRNAPTKLMKEIGYGKDYIYSHEGEGNFSHQEFMPKNLENTGFYSAGSSKKEIEIKEQIEKHWQKKYPI